MMWVWILGGIALAGLVMVVTYGVWLWHKVTDLAAEAAVLGNRLAEFSQLLEQIHVPERLAGSGPAAP